MTLLIKDTDEKTADATPEGAAPAEAPAVVSCPKCSAPVEPGQDWCLNCGEAQASRRLALPGKRAVATVLALTTVLVGGAAVAAYAALNDSSPASTSTQVAQVPAPAPTPSVAAPAPTDATPSATLPSNTAPAPTVTTPKLPKVTDTSPPPASTPVTSAPTTAPKTTSTGDDSSAKTKTGSGTADTRTTTTQTQTQAPPSAIDLDQSAAALYDPYKRDTAAGDATKALDGDPGTSFPVTVAPGSQQIGAGLTVDLGKEQGIRELDITTKTPGFKIEIYATDDTDLPPDVLDTRWAHLKDVEGVGADADSAGKTKVNLGSGSTKYRHLLLWFTAPPTDGSTVRISELKVLG